MLNWILRFIDAFMARMYPKAPVEAPNLPQDTTLTESSPEPSYPPTTATLTNLCLAIKDMEGANPANNNPGNCRYYTGGYLSIYGNVKRSANGFAIFPTYDLGWLYLKNLIKSKIFTHPNWTLLQLFENYAPKYDGNDPVHYSQFVAKRMGVDNGFIISHIVLV